MSTQLEFSFQDFPPLPPKVGRRHTVTKAHRGIAIDPTLDHLLTEEARRNKVTVSGMLDTILWNFFNKPKLSFEE